MVQEARAAAQVRHANLVRVFGTGTLDSTAYIAMELLDGPNLEQYPGARNDQRLPWREELNGPHGPTCWSRARSSPMTSRR